VFAISALIIVIWIDILGIKYFGLIESIMAVIKIAILVIFVILRVLVIIKNGITIKHVV
jgi:amino acid transporter